MIYFILGGARSGKSRHAEQLAKDYEQQGKQDNRNCQGVQRF